MAIVIGKKGKAIHAAAQATQAGTAAEQIEAALERAAQQRKFKVSFNRKAHGPGEAIEGTVAVAESVKARGLRAELCYVEQSVDYVEYSVVDSAELLDSAPEPGMEASFAFRLPEGAPPNWDPAGVIGASAGSGKVTSDAQRLELGNCGRLYWAVVVKAPRRLRSDIVERHAIPLSDDSSAWAAEVPEGSIGQIKRVNKGWDVGIEPDRWALRRGEEVAIDVQIGEPAADRQGLRVGLVAEIHYDVEETGTDSEGHQTTSRETHTATAHEEWGAIDPSVPSQRIRLRVPEDAPFSYGKGKSKKVGALTMTLAGRSSAVALEWKVIAREDKRMRRDPRREAVLQVLP